MRHKAIYLLYPAVKKIGDNAGAFDANNQKVEIDELLVQAKIAELEAAEPMRLLRLERNQKLAETDWVTIKAYSQSLVVSEEWKTYLQSLRDLPETQEPKLDDQGNLTNVDWPEVPE